MDNTPERFAYRCLPLNIANQHGWEILCPYDFTAEWNGSSAPSGVTASFYPGTPPIALGHFGAGILTFHVNHLFRTEEDYDLYVTGPINAPKDGIAPLTGVVETDWNPATFTMNWKFTRANHPVVFERDEPFCHIFPVRRGLLESVTPAVHSMSSNDEISKDFHDWRQGRDKFLKDSRVPGSEAHTQGWQKDYMRGDDPRNTLRTHRTKLKLRNFDTSSLQPPEEKSVD